MPPRWPEDTPAGPHAPDETVSTERSQRIRAAPRVARLVVVYPRPLAGVCPLGEAWVSIGRQPGPAGHLCLAHPTVSRQHAAVRWDAGAGRHAVTDRGSRNGTWLMGQPVSALPRYLDDGAVLRVGDVLAVYERADAPPGPAPQVAREAVPGEALAMQALRAAIARAGADPSPALVLGETGAGKERIAGELHRLSGRKGPLVVVNCAALSPQLVESQLFGHVRGAFTGATAEHPGLFRAATGGTLFLDEFGELPLELQPKLLRAVEQGEVVAVGSTQRHRVDVRLVAATNRSLVGEVEAGRFRRDLYARLALWELHVPPLRARRADIVGWVDRLHAAWCERRGRSGPPLEFEAEALEALLLAPWPDNLRGVQRFVHEQAPNTGAGPTALAGLPAWLRGGGPGPAPAAARVEDVPEDRSSRPQRPRPSREELLAALAANGWSIRATARHYERDRKQISRWIEMYAIDMPLRPDG
jgi:transcriptional regulator with GAF, ATPase, and Fis domain